MLSISFVSCKSDATPKASEKKEVKKANIKKSISKKEPVFKYWETVQEKLSLSDDQVAKMKVVGATFKNKTKNLPKVNGKVDLKAKKALELERDSKFEKIIGKDLMVKKNKFDAGQIGNNPNRKSAIKKADKLKGGQSNN